MEYPVDDIRQMLFSLQKFQILALYTNASVERSVTDSYIFAWSEGVYPFLNESAVWHQPFESCFRISKEPLIALYDLLRERSDNKRPLTFFELEDQCGIRGPRRPGPIWDEMDLVRVCRYFYLHRQFDSAFWIALLENGQCPTVAECISEKLGADYVRFE
jgi:hypothetical protein